MDAAGRTIVFLLDTGATYSVLTSSSRPFSSQSCTVLGVSDKPISKSFTPPLCCLWDRYCFTQSFLVIYALMHQPPLGQDILHKLGTKIVLEGMSMALPPFQLLLWSEDPENPIITNPLEHLIDSEVWDQGVLGKAKFAIPVLINLKNPTHFPNQKQFPIKPEVKLGLQPIISKFLQHGL